MWPLGLGFVAADAGREPDAADVGRDPETEDVGWELTSEDGFRADGVVHTSVYILSTLSISISMVCFIYKPSFFILSAVLLFFLPPFNRK